MEQLINAALQAGAARADIIPVSGVVLDASFRDVCAKNSCGCYGRCWMCPPEIGDIEQLMADVRRYENALLYQTIADLEDSFDIEAMMAAGHAHALVSQRIEDAVKPLLGAHLHLTCGGCHLCERCARADGLPCRMPDRALPPMEGYGIDVYRTVKPTALKYINGQNTVTYFGVVLYGGKR